MCSFSMTSVNKNYVEKSYTTGWVCSKLYEKSSENKYGDLNVDPPLEICGFVSNTLVYGFSTKHGSGNYKVWGRASSKYATKWIVLGGPIIGFRFKGIRENLSIIVGDSCRPKYFGAHKMPLAFAEEKEIKFYWQQSYALYFSECISKGFFYIQNPG